jgi:hypothetical protein
MILKDIRIERFRSIRDEVLPCNPLTILLGPNGAGKSTWLQAIRIFYDVSARITTEDFYGRFTDEPIVIRVTYGDLRPDEAAEFGAYLQQGTLTVTKRITWTDGRMEQKYYAAALQLAAFAPVRAAKGKRDQLAAWNQLVDTGAVPDVSKAKPGQDLDALMRDYEDAHHGVLEPIDREEQFFGPRNIGGGKLDNYTRFVYLPAVRDVTDDTGDSKTGTLNQLLDTLVMRQLHSRPDVQQLKTDFGQRVKDIYDPAKIAELASLSTAISTTLSDFVPGAAFHLTFGDVKLPEIPTPPAIPTVTEDNFPGDISRKGHGLQRAVIFTLLQHLAVLQRAEMSSSSTPEGAGGQEPIPPTGPDLILAIEEPELYQHPQRCRYLLDLLGQLAETPGRGLGARNQVVYTTHSSYFVSLDRFGSIRRVLKSTGTPEEPGTTALAAFSLAAAAQRMAEITGGKPEEFTPDSFRVRAYPVMTSIVSEGFFANAVVIVEGMCEAGALWKVAEILGKEWVRRGVALIPANGKTNIDRPVVIFRGFKIPTYFLFDGDVRHRGAKGEADAIRTNRAYLRMAGAPGVVDFPPTTVAETWGCFEDEFESYCQQEAGATDFEECRAAAASEFSYDQPAEAIKNFDVAASFVARLYAKGKRLPVLEEVVTRVSALLA